MRATYHQLGQPEVQVIELSGDHIRLGSCEDVEVRLESAYVAPLAASLNKTDHGWEFTVHGPHDLRINSHLVRSGERVKVRGQVAVEIFPFAVSLEIPALDDESEDRTRAAWDQAASQLILDVHAQLLKRMDMTGAEQLRRDNDEFLLTLERDIDEIARLLGLFQAGHSALLQHCAALSVQQHLTAQLIERDQGHSDVWRLDGRWRKFHTANDQMEHDLDELASRCTKRLGLPALADLSQKIAVVERGFWVMWDELLPLIQPAVREYLARRYLKKQVKDIVFGYGPLEDLLRLPSITEIMVVDSQRIYVEKAGVLEKSGRRFVSDEVTVNIIERIVAHVNRRIDKSQPLVDARLRDGSRVNAVIPPLAVSGPCLTIRKFPARKMTIEDLIRKGALTRTVAEFLRAAVTARKNVLISGGTGTGKTTLLNCLSDFIPDKERIVTIEDTAELQLHKEHVVRMETKVANVEGRGQYDIRDLVKNALRMRPDRVVVGECRGPEALDMLQAMNTGHDGSMTTIHANTAQDVILRLEVLVQMNSEAKMPVESTHRQIASAIDLVVQLSRLRDGRRCVTQVTELVRYDQREQRIITKDLFLMDAEAPEGALAPTGHLPTFMGQLIEMGLIKVEAFYL